MKKKMGWLLVLILLTVAAGSLSAATDNTILHITGGGAGYSTAILTDPDKVPLLMIQPSGTDRLQDFSFELRLRNAVWDFDAYREMGIDNFGDIDSDGVFTPVNDSAGYLTGVRSPMGLDYRMVVGEQEHTAVVTVDPYTIVSSLEALYIPILAEVTGDPATLELYDQGSSGLSVGAVYPFASGSVGGVTTQVRTGEIKEFSQTVALADLTIRELRSRAMTSNILTLTAPTGYRWINIEQVRMAGSNAGQGISTRSYGLRGPEESANQAVLRLELALTDSPEGAPRTLVFQGLQLAAEEGNPNYGPVSVSLSGCNMEPETVRAANRVRVYYTFAAGGAAPLTLAAGQTAADPVSDSLRTLTATLEEVTPGIWRSENTTTFALPAGITARAVKINTTNLAADLPRDTVIRRIDENAFAIETEDGGFWTLAPGGLTIQRVKSAGGQPVKLELTFYVEAAADFRGPVFLTAGGSALTHESQTAIAEVVDPAADRTVSLTVGSREMWTAAGTVAMDAAPYIEDGYTMVPVRYVAGALSLADGAVKWNAEAGTVTVNTGVKQAVLTVGSQTMTVDGVTQEIAAAPVVRDGRTFLPFRVLGEQVLGVAVGWDEASQTAFFY